MRFLFAILFVTFTASSSLAQVLCQTIGIQTFCSNGQVFQNLGNQNTAMTFHNDIADVANANLATVQAQNAQAQAARNAASANALAATYGPAAANPDWYNMLSGPRAQQQLANAEYLRALAGLTQARVNALNPQNNRPFLPQGGSPKISQLQQQSREFVLTVYRNMSRANDQVLATLGNIYAETVSYFGEDLSREQIISRIGGFYARWPIRQYTPKDDSIRIDCDEASLTCAVAGQLQFDAQSPDRNQHSRGTATFEYLISFDTPGQTPQIAVENGTTLERSTASLVAQPNNSPLGSTITSRSPGQVR